MSQFDEGVIPGEQNDLERDPWFDRPFDKLTVLSKVEGLTTLSHVEGSMLSNVEASKGNPEKSRILKSFWLPRQRRRGMRNRHAVHEPLSSREGDLNGIWHDLANKTPPL